MATHVTRTREDGMITSKCDICQESVGFPDKGLGRAYAAAWESRHQHPEASR